MAEDVAIHLDFSWLSIDTQYLTFSHVFNWLVALEWWEWLLILKLMFVFWILNVTVIVPSIYMQVLLYTDEMTSRMLHSPAQLSLEMSSLVQWAIARYSVLQKKEEFEKNRTGKIIEYFSGLRQRKWRTRRSAKTPWR